MPSQSGNCGAIAAAFGFPSSELVVRAGIPGWAAVGAGAMAGADVIGLNPVARGMTGKYALDSCAAGNVTLEFGNNELMGGSVASTFTLVLPSARVTAAIDSAELVREGGLA